MTRNRLFTVLALCLSLTLAIVAQESRPNSFNAIPPPFGATIPAPPTNPPGQRGVRPATMYPNPQSSSTPPRGEEHYSVLGKVQLSDGTTLSGEIHSDGPLQGMALFGSIAIPLNQIRGIDWQTRSDQKDDSERKAKVILINDDSLTVTLTVPTIQLKTDWGHAAVELAKVQSIILGSEKYKWEDTPLGRQLVPEDNAKPATDASTFGT
jgi:nitrogen fixation-related uncharacterized protein